MSSACSWVVFYAFRSLFWRGLDNLSRLPADHSRKALSRRGFHRPKCVDGRRFQRRLYVCVESFKSRAIFYIRHITSPCYILLFIGCPGNDVVCAFDSFYNSYVFVLFRYCILLKINCTMTVLGKNGYVLG